MPESEEELLRRDRALFTLIDDYKALEAENARLLKAMDEFRRVAQYDRDDARRAHEQIDALRAEIEDLRRKVPSGGIIAALRRAREERDALRVEVAALRRRVGVPTECMIASARAIFAETRALSPGCPA